MYSVLGMRTIAIRKLYNGTVLYTYDKVHRYPPLSDVFLNFGFTKGPPLLHSTNPNTIIHKHSLVANGHIDMGDNLTFDFSTFDVMNIIETSEDPVTHIRYPQMDRI